MAGSDARAGWNCHAVGYYDKNLGREMVDSSSPYRFGQYLYVTGADELPNRLVEYRAISPVPDLWRYTLPAEESWFLSSARPSELWPSFNARA